MARSSRAMAFTFGRTSTTSFIGDIFWSGHWGADEQDEILQVPYCEPYNFLKNLAMNGKYFQEFPLQFDGNYYLKKKKSTRDYSWIYCEGPADRNQNMQKCVLLEILW